jgi:hypothetical protein
MFNGAEFIAQTNSVDHLVGNEQLPAKVVELGNIERAAAYIESRQREIRAAEAATGGPWRSQYRWRCPHKCFDLIDNDVNAIHRLFDLYAADGEATLALAAVDEFQKKKAMAARTRRKPARG